MSKTNQVLKALEAGEELTAAQITARYGAASPGRVVHYLRGKGYSIYLNKRTNSKGHVKGKYRLGSPSRKIVAAGYKAMQLGLV